MHPNIKHPCIYIVVVIVHAHYIHVYVFLTFTSTCLQSINSTKRYTLYTITTVDKLALASIKEREGHKTKREKSEE